MADRLEDGIGEVVVLVAKMEKRTETELVRTLLFWAKVGFANITRQG
jgi:hypothetical protein